MFTCSSYKYLADLYKQQLAELSVRMDETVADYRNVFEMYWVFLRRAHERILDLEAENALLRITYENPAILEIEDKLKFYRVS